jgi:hypothetical protein
MSDDIDGFLPGDESDSSTAGGHPQPADPVATLSWAMLDDQITEDEVGLLDSLLLSDKAARDSYVKCVQLHTDLLFHFQDRQQPATTAAAKTSPVLGFLGDMAQPFGVQPPKAEDSRA